MRRAAALLAAALVMALAPAAAVGAECPRTSLAEIESDVMCPVCGTSLAVASEAPQAERQRALIQRLVDRCRSREQIEAALVAEYGEDVLALPEAEGFDLTAYLVPALVVLAAAGAVALAARRWRAAGGPPAARPTDDPAAAERLDADLDRYER